MTLNEYQKLAARTFIPSDAPPEQSMTFACSALGLVCEAGEVGDILKKVIFHRHPLDKAKVEKELGDVLWYLAALATELDIDLDAVAEANIAKLRARYPNGFTHADSLVRRDLATG